MQNGDFRRMSIIIIRSSRSSDGGGRHSFRGSSSVVLTIVCIDSCGGSVGCGSRSSSGSVSICDRSSNSGNCNHGSSRNSRSGSDGSDSIIKWK